MYSMWNSQIFAPPALPSSAAASPQRAAALGRRRVSVGRGRLLFGLANGWASPPGEKFALFDVQGCADGWAAAGTRGFMFWNLQDEGLVPGRTPGGGPLFLAQALGERLRTTSGATGRQGPAEEL